MTTRLHDVSRTAAGLKPPRRVSRRAPSVIDTLVIHYSTGEELGQPDDLAWWRSIQAFHMGPSRRWDDLGYNYGIHARVPRVLEGRGLLAVGAHAPGWNTRSVGLCVLGDDDPGQDVLDDVLTRIIAFRRDLEDELGRRVRVVGHRDTQRKGYTACPGDELAAWVAAGMPAPTITPAPAPTPGPAPAPSPRPTPPAEELPMPPTIRQGATGFHVRLLQGALVAQGVAPRNTIRSDGTFDGVFGGGTDGAVRAFQRRSRLVVDGVVGPNTWRRLWAP